MFSICLAAEQARQTSPSPPPSSSHSAKVSPSISSTSRAMKNTAVSARNSPLNKVTSPELKSIGCVRIVSSSNAPDDHAIETIKSMNSAIETALIGMSNMVFRRMKQELLRNSWAILPAANCPTKPIDAILTANYFRRVECAMEGDVIVLTCSRTRTPRNSPATTPRISPTSSNRNPLCEISPNSMDTIPNVTTSTSPDTDSSKSSMLPEVVKPVPGSMVKPQMSSEVRKVTNKVMISNLKTDSVGTKLFKSNIPKSANPTSKPIVHYNQKSTNLVKSLLASNSAGPEKNLSGKLNTRFIAPVAIKPVAPPTTTTSSTDKPLASAVPGFLPNSFGFVQKFGTPASAKPLKELKDMVSSTGGTNIRKPSSSNRIGSFLPMPKASEPVTFTAKVSAIETSKVDVQNDINNYTVDVQGITTPIATLEKYDVNGNLITENSSPSTPQTAVMKPSTKAVSAKPSTASIYTDRTQDSSQSQENLTLKQLDEFRVKSSVELPVSNLPLYSPSISLVGNSETTPNPHNFPTVNTTVDTDTWVGVIPLGPASIRSGRFKMLVPSDKKVPGFITPSSTKIMASSPDLESPCVMQSIKMQNFRIIGKANNLTKSVLNEEANIANSSVQEVYSAPLTKMGSDTENSTSHSASHPHIFIKKTTQTSEQTSDNEKQTITVSTSKRNQAVRQSIVDNRMITKDTPSNKDIDAFAGKQGKQAVPISRKEVFQKRDENGSRQKPVTSGNGPTKPVIQKIDVESLGMNRANHDSMRGNKHQAAATITIGQQIPMNRGISLTSPAKLTSKKTNTKAYVPKLTKSLIKVATAPIKCVTKQETRRTGDTISSEVTYDSTSMLGEKKSMQQWLHTIGGEKWMKSEIARSESSSSNRVECDLQTKKKVVGKIRKAIGNGGVGILGLHKGRRTGVSAQGVKGGVGRDIRW